MASSSSAAGVVTTAHPIASVQHVIQDITGPGPVIVSAVVPDMSRSRGDAQLIKVMEGVRVLEVAQFTFVPAAGAILADWGADVIKVEHPVRGDTQRGFINMGGLQLDPRPSSADGTPQPGQAQRRHRRVDTGGSGGALRDRQERRRVPDELPAAARQKNKFDVEHIRAANPDIIYARGSAYGDKGPERDVGGFDGTAFWTRSGVGWALTPRRWVAHCPRAFRPSATRSVE